MKKIFLFLGILSIFSLPSKAQETTEDQESKAKHWVVKGMSGLNMSQTTLTNWAAGGENTVAGNVFFQRNSQLHQWEMDLGQRP